MNRVVSYTMLILLFVTSVFLYAFVPNSYSYEYSLYCFAVFLCSASVLLINNVRKYGAFFLFEVIFTFSFFFVNYVYPIFLYRINPFFSLFLHNFNEDIITKCTALATMGYTAYSLGQYSRFSVIERNFDKPRTKLKPLGVVDIIILLILLADFVIPNLEALQGNYSTSGSGGFFLIFAVFYVYKYFVFSKEKVGRALSFCFFAIIIVYVALNFLLGNRGDPLYLLVAIIFVFNTFVKKIRFSSLMLIGLTGLMIFYFVGKTRISSNQFGVNSRSEKIENLEAESNFLLYAEELIINNRSSFVLVDYADTKGFSYGQTWAGNFFSVIPFGQSFALNFLDIKQEKFTTAKLNTFIEFGNNNPDAFGLGTNLIGDIYVSFGSFGVAIFMLLFGCVVRIVYTKGISGSTYSQIVYMLLIMLAVYYPRSTLFTPLQMATWTYFLLYFNRRRM